MLPDCLQLQKIFKTHQDQKNKIFGHFLFIDKNALPTERLCLFGYSSFLWKDTFFSFDLPYVSTINN